MSSWLQRCGEALRLAWIPCLLTVTAALIPIGTIFASQGRSIAKRGAVSVSRWEALCYDLPFALRPTRPRNDVLLVLITTNDIERLDADRNSRIDREHLARALKRLGDLRPRLLVVDLLLSEATESEADLALAEQLRRLGPVTVLATSGVGPSEQPNPLFASTGVTLGNVDVDRHPWNTVRLLPSIFSRETGQPAVAYAAAAKIDGVNLVDTRRRSTRWLDYYGPGARHGLDGPFRTTTLTEWAIENPTPIVSLAPNPLVFIGDARRDVFRNPIDGEDLAGVEVHATALLNLHERSWLRLVPVPLQLAFMILWGAGIAVSLDWNRTAKTRWQVLGATLVLALSSITLPWLTGMWWWWLIAVGIQAPVALLVSARPAPGQFFISYRDSDGHREALWLEGALRGVGRRAFLAPGQIESGEEIWPELERSIARSRVFLLLLTPHVARDLAPRPPTTSEAGPAANRIPWVARELSHALSLRRRILVLRIGTPPPKREDLLDDVARVVDRLSLEYRIDNRDEVLDAVLRSLLSRRPSSP